MPSPVLSGFSNYLWPLLLGSRDMAFPRLNALSYWIYLASGIFLYVGFLTGNGPNDGWFNYVPYAARAYNPGLNEDFYSLGMVFLGISTTVGAANFIVTALRTRAPGMSINRLPILIWGTLTASAANLVVVPAVSLAFLMLWMDRQFGTHFFDPRPGRPAAAVAAPVLDLRPSLGLRHRAARDGHGLRRPAGLLPPSAGRLLVGGAVDRRDHDPGLRRLGAPHVRHRAARPGAVILFRRVDRDHRALGGGRVRLARHDLASDARSSPPPSCSSPAMILLFVIGGVSGFMTASVPVDWQLTDTYFVVAHLHYVLIGINVFPVVGATYFWFPKMTGRTAGRASRPLELLDHVPRLQPRVPAHAPDRPAGHAAPHLHL